LTVTGATGAFANSNLTFTGGILSVGAPTVGAATNSVNVQGGYYVNGVLQTGGATIAGSTTAGNLLTATGTSSGVYGNSGLTWSPSTTTLTVAGSSSNTTINGYGIGLGGNAANISYQLSASGQIYAGGTNGFVGTLLGGVNLNGGTLSNGTINNAGYNTTSSNFTTYTTGSSNYIGGTVLSNGYAAIGTTTMPAFQGLTVNGGLSLAQGYRPLYSNVTTSNLTTGAYGYHYNITNSAFSSLTLGSGTGSSNDYNAYWVLRNNTGSYLNITVTYTVSGGTPSNTVTIPPANSLTMMFIATTGGSAGVVFF
jgi:hypothetical protein